MPYTTRAGQGSRLFGLDLTITNNMLLHLP